jgi:hypothetical protein
MVMERTRSYWTGLSLQTAVVVLYCAWVLSMPVFPTQDGPLHLYCVEVFRQLLAHKPGIYSQTYYINRYLPPYSLYYYGLIVLGKAMTLQMADKVIACAYFITLPLGLRALVRSVAGSADWAPLLFMPVLLSWPLMMGFVNYCIALGFACFALAAWMRSASRRGLAARIPFLLWIVLILLTHPVPWMFVLAFCFFDLGVRLLRYWLAQDRASACEGLGDFRSDAIAALVGCLGSLYLLHFRSPLPPSETFVHVPLGKRTVDNALDYLRTRGLTLYAGTHGAVALYRLGITVLFVGMLALAIWSGVRLLRERRWSPWMTWLLFSGGFLIVLPTVPAELNGSYYFAWRLLFILFLCVVVAVSTFVEQPSRLRAVLLAVAVAVSVLNVWLAVRFISPWAQRIVSLRNAPLVATDKPGLVMWPAAAWRPDELTFNPEYWAGANYMREHNLVLYNTSWIYIQIIPIKPLPSRVSELDYTYEIGVPQPGGFLMHTPAEARALLGRVGYVVAMRVNTPAEQSPLAMQEGSPTQDQWASGWSCDAQRAWSLCAPRGTRLASNAQR